MVVMGQAWQRGYGSIACLNEQEDETGTCQDERETSLPHSSQFRNWTTQEIHLSNEGDEEFSSHLQGWVWELLFAFFGTKRGFVPFREGLLMHNTCPSSKDRIQNPAPREEDQTWFQANDQCLGQRQAMGPRKPHLGRSLTMRLGKQHGVVGSTWLWNGRL